MPPSEDDIELLKEKKEKLDESLKSKFVAPTLFTSKSTSEALSNQDKKVVEKEQKGLLENVGEGIGKALEFGTKNNYLSLE